jgi:hypothetical protein
MLSATLFGVLRCCNAGAHVQVDKNANGNEPVGDERQRRTRRSTKLLLYVHAHRHCAWFRCNRSGLLYLVTARSHACEHTNNESVAMHVVFWCRRSSMSDEEQVGLESIGGFGHHKSWSLIKKAPETSADLWSPPKLSSFPGYNGIPPHNRSTTMI